MLLPVKEHTTIPSLEERRKRETGKSSFLETYFSKWQWLLCVYKIQYAWCVSPFSSRDLKSFFKQSWCLPLHEKKAQWTMKWQSFRWKRWLKRCIQAYPRCFFFFFFPQFREQVKRSEEQCFFLIKRLCPKEASALKTLFLSVFQIKLQPSPGITPLQSQRCLIEPQQPVQTGFQTATWRPQHAPHPPPHPQRLQQHAAQVWHLECSFESHLLFLEELKSKVTKF